ncbi:MAG: CoA-acylating methylmalonate-semialdehyde dehydrogenase [Bacteriovoracaceae bacterium]
MTSVEIPNEKMNCQNFTNGEFVNGSGDQFDIHSPYNGEVIGTSNSSTKEDVDKAIEFADLAFHKWKQTPLKERTKIMFEFRNLLLRDIESLSHIVSAENGKTHAESKAGILKGIEVLEFALSLQNLDSGAKMEVSRGVQCEYRREPLGVVANITPFNFPAMVPMWTLPIVITLGNSYVWKPSEKTPLTSHYMAKLFKEAGLPDGVLTVLQGEKESVNAIIEHPKVKAVGFVGSTKIAKLVYSKATSLGKRALALGGAKNHIILLPDADNEISGRGISDSFTGCAGQRCMAASVLLAVGDTDTQIEHIVKRAKSNELGKSMGAIITQKQVQFLNDSIAQAEKDGAKILLDGRKTQVPSEYEKGFWVGPTILDNVNPESDAARVELFGPIISIIRCENLTQALEIENQTPYGNACSVFTDNGALAERVSKEASAGMVGINVGVPVPREPFSFGGINDSKFGHGDITGVHSLNFWSNVKKVTTKWEMQKDNNWMS